MYGVYEGGHLDEVFVLTSHMPSRSSLSPPRRSDNRHVDVGHLRVRPVEELEEEATRRGYPKPPTAVINNMKMQCREWVEAAGGKEKQSVLRYKLVTRDIKYWVGNEYWVLAELDRQVGW